MPMTITSNLTINDMIFNIEVVTYKHRLNPPVQGTTRF